MEVKKQCRQGQTAFERIAKLLSRLAENLSVASTSEERLFKIPVCYDPLLAPDLGFVAKEHGIDTEHVIHLHTSITYHVYMLGFLPGFAYMATVDQKIATQRKAVPRTKVPAGSVGIAGDQTGIYPLISPGGWQLIGQTPLMLFNHQLTPPTLLQPGDQVQFYPISLTEYKQLKYP